MIELLLLLLDYKTEAMSYSPGVPVAVIVDITNNTSMFTRITVIVSNNFL